MVEATFVIVGGGVAGVSCAEALSALCPSESVLLVTASPAVKTVTNLSHLTKLVSTFDVNEQKAGDFGCRNDIRVEVTDPIKWIKPREKVVETAAGTRFTYKHLCLCHGARPKIDVSGPFVLSIRDTHSVIEFQKSLVGAKRIVIVGNGGIATEMVHELQSVDIVWVVKDDAISSTFFDSGAAEFFVSKLQQPTEPAKDGKPSERLKYFAEGGKRFTTGGALGPDWHLDVITKGKKQDGTKAVHVEYGSDIQRIFTAAQSGKNVAGNFKNIKIYQDECSWNVYVELSNGKIIGCDFVVSAIGVIPNGDQIKVVPGNGEKLQLNEGDGGILVNEHMETNVPFVYAAGDVCHANWECSKHWFQMRLWTQARQMGKHAAQCLHVAHESLGKEKKDLDFCFELFTHATKFFGYKVILLGIFNGQKLIDHEVLLRVTEHKEYIKVLMSKDGRIQGAILIGETNLEETLENLILNQLDLSSYGADLLDPDVDIEDYFD